MFSENIKMSWQNIINNKMRSFLTILGIVIGVTAIIALISIVQGVIDESNRQFMGMGTGKITVQAFGTPLKQGLTFSDIERISEIENVTGVSPNLNLTSSVVKDGNVIEDVTIEGKNDVYFRTTEDVISRGRFFNILDMENKNKVAIIDNELSQSLLFGRNPLGDRKSVV